jgi:hypothetical protein
MAAKKGTGLLMVWTDVPADYRAVVGTPAYLTFYEFEHPKVSESPEWHAQRNAVPASERMRTHMRHAQGSPGVNVKTFELKR